MINPVLNSFRTHEERIGIAIRRVLESGQYILGQEGIGFESEFSQYIGTRYGIGVASGTDAITIALEACRIGDGDEVITVANTAVATVAAIERAGAVPVLADIDPVTYTIDPECIRNAITDKTRAIVPVHLYGCPADMDAINAIAGARDLCVIEDCAQSHGAALNGKLTGTFGDAAAFSFYPTKNLGALGDGGMVVTDNRRTAERARLLRQYGWKDPDRGNSLISGMNSRMDEIQAAILRTKLPHLDRENALRRKIARVYNKHIRGDVVLPTERAGRYHVYHQYVIRVKERDALRKFLAGKGIPTSIHYPIPIHLQKAYEFALGNPSLPVTEQVSKEIISLPMNPYLDRGHVLETCTAINEFLEGV